jgi:hypothetical protein
MRLSTIWLKERRPSGALLERECGNAPHSGFVPSSKSAVSEAARRPQFKGYVVPTAASHQHVPHDLDHPGRLRASSLPPSGPMGTSADSRVSNSAKNNASGIRLHPILAPPMDQDDTKGTCAHHVPNEGASGPVSSLRRWARRGASLFQRGFAERSLVAGARDASIGTKATQTDFFSPWRYTGFA